MGDYDSVSVKEFLPPLAHILSPMIWKELGI